ncbi:hypothetical protein F5883DRAFT_663540 [Diaporthe sp. PMI_573]|nr:hypothetical protein F5883DRAFT_663540 [Diaporthaceae sp. PMI_573]
MWWSPARNASGFILANLCGKLHCCAVRAFPTMDPGPPDPCCNLPCSWQWSLGVAVVYKSTRRRVCRENLPCRQQTIEVTQVRNGPRQYPPTKPVNVP